MRTWLDKEQLISGPPELGCVLSLPGLPGGGSKICDTSPYGNVGSITGATWVRLPSGLWCLSFDGQDDFVDCGDAGHLRFTSSFTIKTWVKVDTLAGEQDFVTSQTGGTSGYGLYKTGGVATVNFIINGLSGATLGVSNIITPEVWCQLIGVYSAPAGKRYFYKNGAEVGNDSPTGTPIVATENLRLGSYRGTSGWVNGCVALPEIYGYPWSALDVQNSFNQEKHLFGVW